MAGSLRQSGKALLHLSLLAAVIWGAGYMITTSRWSLQVYGLWRFPNAEAHHLAGALAKTQRASDDVCLLVGPSTVREAFDESAMQEASPDLTFINAGTTGGGIYVFEAMNQVIRQSKVRPKYVVVGLNARMLIARDIRLNAAGYTDFLDLTNGREIAAREQSALQPEARDELVTNTIWPYHRLARHLGRLMRSALFRMQEELSWREPLPLTAFAFGHRELGRSPLHLYDDSEPISGAQWQQLMKVYEQQGMFDRSRYAHPKHMASLRAVLDDLMAITPNLVVIQMPEHSFARENLAPLASDAMETLLAEYHARGVRMLDLSDALPDSSLRDVGHLLGSARPDFSRMVAQMILDPSITEPGASDVYTALYSR